jgi:hypothetical protein
MVLPNSGKVRTRFSLSLALSFLFVAQASSAQSWAPIPGSTGAPAPTGGSAFSAMPTLGGYNKLPLTPVSAAGRLEELRNLMLTTRPKHFQDAISEYSDWLSDMADAHWKLAQAFAKDSSTRGYAESERQLNQKFGGLKRQAMLLKAEFLIGQKRYPEALGPLVDIVSAEPKTETGRNAYKLLRQIGFSDPTAVAAPSAPAAVEKPPSSEELSATSKSGPPSKPAQTPLAKSR